MRLLMVTPFPPDLAADHGGGLYLGSIADALARHAELGLVSLVKHERPAGGPWQWHGTAPYLGAGRGAAHKLRMAWLWGRGLPLLAAKHWQPQLPALLRRAIEEFRPDAALVELATMAQYLPWLRGTFRVFTDHEDAGQSGPLTGLGAAADRRDRSLWQRHMQRAAQQAELLQALTAEDAATLRAITGREVQVRPAVVQVPERPVDAGAAPPHLLFLGDYAHPPNPEAATRIANDVLPLLRARDSSVELLLAGQNQQRIEHLRGRDGVRLLGYVSDLHALMAQARLLLGPLWSGGGFRMKAITAMAHGLPVVTNMLGARGTDAPATARAIAETPEQLAAACWMLLADRDAARRAGQAAHAWAREQLSAEAVARRQLAAIEAGLRTQSTAGRTALR